MTWMEVRDAIKAGKSLAIIGTGGLEQNGPYCPTGKHNYVLRATTEAIARRLEEEIGIRTCGRRNTRREPLERRRVKTDGEESQPSTVARLAEHA